MTSTFKYHSQVDEVVPWQATYNFPTQASKVNKQTVKLVPKNGQSFTSGNIVRIEFPADNYLNVLNSVLQFDSQFTVSGAGTVWGTATTVTAGSNSVFFEITSFTAGSGSGALSTSENAYTGWTLIVQSGGFTFTSVVAYHNYETGPKSQFTLAVPLPQAVDDGDIITLVPPYYLQRGGSQNFIKRLRVMYGSLVLEDIQEYKSLVRIFFEAGVDPSAAAGAQNILEGMYHTRVNDAIATNVTEVASRSEWANDPVESGKSQEQIARMLAYRGVTDGTVFSQMQCAPAVSSIGAPVALGATGSSVNTGRTAFCINLLSGIFTQKKLIPLKWMASQLAIEITLSSEADCVIAGSASASISYQLSNINFIAELLEFDSAYDNGFYSAIKSGGVPIKFDTFHYHSFSMSGTYNVYQIHERARSVKSAFAVMRDSTGVTTLADSDKFFFALQETWSSGALSNGGRGQVQQYQWRIGGRYYPAQPVRTIYGSSEALIELQKALDMLGDYTRQGMITPRRWSSQNGGIGAAFIMAAPFENTDVFPDTIAGVNAEEQSDIALTIVSDNTGGAAPVTKRLEVFMHYDCLMIVRDGNVVDLVY